MIKNIIMKKLLFILLILSNFTFLTLFLLRPSHQSVNTQLSYLENTSNMALEVMIQSLDDITLKTRKNLQIKRNKKLDKHYNTFQNNLNNYTDSINEILDKIDINNYNNTYKNISKFYTKIHYNYGQFLDSTQNIFKLRKKELNHSKSNMKNAIQHLIQNSLLYIADSTEQKRLKPIDIRNEQLLLNRIKLSYINSIYNFTPRRGYWHYGRLFPILISEPNKFIKRGDTLNFQIGIGKYNEPYVYDYTIQVEDSIFHNVNQSINYHLIASQKAGRHQQKINLKSIRSDGQEMTSIYNLEYQVSK